MELFSFSVTAAPANYSFFSSVYSKQTAVAAAGNVKCITSCAAKGFYFLFFQERERERSFMS